MSQFFSLRKEDDVDRKDPGESTDKFFNKRKYVIKLWLKIQMNLSEIFGNFARQLKSSAATIMGFKFGWPIVE